MSTAPTPIFLPGPPISSAGNATPSAKVVTYDELLGHHHQRLEERFGRENVSAKQAKQIKSNHLAAINDWMRQRGLTKQSLVGAEFGEDFDEELERHTIYLRAKPHRRKGMLVKGLASSTIGNRRSILGQWRDSFADCVAAGQSWRTLPEALNYLIKSRGVTLGRFAREADVCPIKLSYWLANAYHPSRGDGAVKAISKIELYCGLHEGELTSLIKPTYRNARGGATGSHTAFGLRLQTASAETYRINEFPSRLQKEFDGWVDLMTSLLEPEGPFKRNGFWFVDPETRDCPTARRVKGSLAGFFGYLCLPVEGRQFPATYRDKNLPEVGYTVVKGEGFSESQMTLALLADIPLVKRFLEFVRERAGGSYNGETLFFLNMCCALLRAGTGYVRQHSDYGERLSPPVASTEWDEYCGFAHRRYRDLLRELKKNGHIVQTRDVEEPIDFILNDPHPIRYLYELADMMEECLPTTAAKYQRAMEYRDVFLVRFITANPLRIKHFAAMTWRADNTGNLYQERDGSWWLRFPKEAFKNRRRLKKDKSSKKYRSPLPPSLWPYVDAYLFECRPLLLGADKCDYVFRPGPRGGTFKHKTGDTKPMRPGSLSSILHNRAKEFLRCMGFGPHAYRHIIATDYLKNHPGGIMIAASILHDKPETVLEHYGHLQHADYFRNWLTYHEEQLEASRARKTEGGEQR